MENKYSNGFEWNFKKVVGFILLLILPNFLGMINLGTIYGFKIHFFQLAIFISALIYGPMGGLLSGIIGSVFSAVAMHNPYLIIGNAILGFFVGYFAGKKLNTILSVCLAFLIQLPWLIFSDYFFVNMPMVIIIPLIVALAISNLIWAIVTNYSIKPIKEMLK